MWRMRRIFLILVDYRRAMVIWVKCSGEALLRRIVDEHQYSP